jgi:hypothetical protein
LVLDEDRKFHNVAICVPARIRGLVCKPHHVFALTSANVF